MRGSAHAARQLLTAFNRSGAFLDQLLPSMAAAGSLLPPAPVQWQAAASLSTAFVRNGDAVVGTKSRKGHFRPGAAPFYPAVGRAGHSHSVGPAFVPDQRSMSGRRIMTVATSSASLKPLAGEVDVGCLIAYQRERDSHAGLALVQGRHGKRGWSALTARGLSMALTPQQVAMVLPGGPYTAADLQLIAQQAAAAAEDSSLIELAWEVSNSSSTYSVPHMAELLYGGAATPAACAAAHSLLSADRTFFKQSGRLPPAFIARTAAAVAQIQAATAAELKRTTERALFVGDIHSVRKSQSGKPGRELWLSGRHAATLSAVEQLALAMPGTTAAAQAAGASLVAEAMAALQINATPDAAGALLKSIGWWEPHAQLPLLRLGITPDFDLQLQSQAASLQQTPPPDPDATTRLDLTAQNVVTIDDASTTEVDDGLSAEQLPDGRWRLWVHIADPSRWLHYGHPLEEEAGRRSKTAYLPTGMVPMFPHALAEGPFSLRSGVGPLPAMSVSAILAADGSLEEYTVAPSLIQPRQRMTYEEVDARLQDSSSDEDPAFLELAQAALRRREWRAAQGAVEISTPEAQVKVNLVGEGKQPEVKVTALNSADSPARQLVAEMMILAGEVIGTLGAEAELPLPYRGQAEPMLPSEENMAAIPEGLCRAIAVRNRMTRSITTTAAGERHAALGLPTYVQFTSPIRRYNDLLAHYQIKAHLRGDALPLSAPQLDMVLEATNAASRELTIAERTVEGYWLARFFAASGGAAFLGQLVCWARQDTGMAKVVLDIGLEVAIRINRPAQLGERIAVSCVAVDECSYQLAETALPLSMQPPMTPPHPQPLPFHPLAPLIH